MGRKTETPELADDVVEECKQVWAAARRAKKKPWRVKPALFAIISLVFGGGLVLMGLGIHGLVRFRGASHLLCRIRDFPKLSNATLVAALSSPYQGRSCLGAEACSFDLAVHSDEFGPLLVHSWGPALEMTHSSSTISLRLTNTALRCCPTEPLDNCCGFFDEVSQTFCDRWGAPPRSISGCQTRAWPCHIFDLEQALASGEPLSPSLLHEGDVRAPLWPLIGGVFLAVPSLFAQILLLLGGPRQAWRRCRQAAAAPGVAWQARRERARRRDRESSARRQRAAVEIQRLTRGFLARRAACQLLVEDLKSKVPSRRVPPCFWPLLKRQVPAHELWHLWRPVVTPDPPPSDSRDSVPPVPRWPLYDTGSGNTFKRLERVRVRSSPGDLTERLEVVLDEQAPHFGAVLDVVVIRRLEGGSKDKGGRPCAVIVRTLPCSLAASYGLRRGLRLVQAGALEWPAAEAEELLAELRQGARPLLLVFEGPPRPAPELPRRPEDPAPTPPRMPPPALAPAGARLAPGVEPGRLGSGRPVAEARLAPQGTLLPPLAGSAPSRVPRRPTAPAPPWLLPGATTRTPTATEPGAWLQGLGEPNHG